MLDSDLTYVTEDHSGDLITKAEGTSLSVNLKTISLHSALPVELWSNVFTFATAFHNFDPLVIAIGRTAKDLIAEWKRSLRFRKAILRVCRTWRSAGLHLLYEYIVITEIPQLARIVQLMEGIDQPGWWTRTLYVRCAIMLHWHAFYEKHIAILIASCPNMTRFIDGVVVGELSPGMYRPLPPMIHEALAAPRSAALHTLDMARDDGVNIELLILLAPTLAVLSLQGVYLDITEGQPVKEWTLQIPLLVYLEVHSPRPIDPPPPSWVEPPPHLRGKSPHILKRPICPQVKWIVPRLRSLAMRTMTSRGGMNPDEQQFILDNGPNLVELDLLGEGNMPEHALYPHPFLDMCPNLLSLALTVHHDTSYHLPRPYNSLTGLILRDTSSYLSIFERNSLLSCLEEGFPSLQSIRLLSVVHSNPTPLDDEDRIPAETSGGRWDSWRHWVLDFKRRGIRLENVHGDVIRLRDYTVEDWDRDSQMDGALDSTMNSSDSDDEHELMPVSSEVRANWAQSDSDFEMDSEELRDREHHPPYRWEALGDLEYEDDPESEYEETPYVVDEAGALDIFSRTAATVSPPVTPSAWDPLAMVYFPITERRD